jgi:hypothetical protein
MQRCPAHEDRTASLSLREGDDGRALLYCHAGCDVGDVCAALGLNLSDLFSDGDGVIGGIYVYTDEHDWPLYRVRRLQPKTFRQDRYVEGEWVPGMGDVRRVPYHLARLLASDEVWITEGEKDCDNLYPERVACATSLLSSVWRPEYAPYFRGKAVVLCGDNDGPGRKKTAALKVALLGVAASVRVVRPPAEYNDVTEFLLAGGGLGALVDEVDDLSLFEEVDWRDYKAEKTEWLLEPYVPRAARVLAYGAPGSLKSLWGLWLGAHLADEGHKVAYFSLEMRPTESARRVRQLSPGPGFRLFTQFRFTSPEHVAQCLSAFKDYSLIVIDSWSSAYPHRDSNEEIARLDNDVFQPIISATGATLLILDNVGQPSFAQDGTKVTPDWARGASAKGDKMELALFFARPFEEDNYTTDLSVKKMRIDQPMPGKSRIGTPRDKIEFYYVRGGERMEPMWPGMQVTLEAGSGAESATPTSGTGSTESPEPLALSLSEKLAKARVEHAFREIDVTGSAGETQASVSPTIETVSEASDDLPE